MYLLTFSMIVIAVLGMYTQLYAVQVSRMFANQTVLADSLTAWHEGAASLASNVVNANNAMLGGLPLTIIGCSLTVSLTTPFYCQLGPASSGNANVTVAGNGIYVNAGQAYPELPSSANTAIFQWKSIFFVGSNNQDYVISYVVPPVIANGQIFTGSPTPQKLDFTMSDLMHQLQISSLPAYAYGYVNSTGGVLQTSATLPAGAPTNGANINYQIPTSVPKNSLAIISPITPCTTC